ncbi:glycosyltransferase [Nostocoides sp. F2B08]|uniref:glycosyltransferase family 4 protein n=1 Tax=Nostocoides sp. F2B08 TaxID=2653936 RepID=UPI00126347BA|nr:glycosyltransferase family 4 protein [Tetrasphaera sp. F2B08]KAB7743334.1 glycosyltransferase [Tetrasphaera sp. F2B08]
MTDQNTDRLGANAQVLAFAPFYLPGFKGGGPIRSMAEILRALPSTVSVLLVTSDRDLGDGQPYPGLSSTVVADRHHRIYYWDRASAKSWWHLSRLVVGPRFELLFLNSLWSPSFSMLPWFLARGRLIRTEHLVVAPRGELSPGALGIKARKKRLALATWGRLVARSAPVWQVSSEMERDDVRRVFPSADVVQQPDSRGPEPMDLVESGPEPRFAFVSRISPKKNLLFLLESLRRCRETVTLDVYGPTEDAAYWGRCTAKIGEMPPNVRVRYAGTLGSDQVQSRLATYDAFLFPTLGENFGFVIPESLSAGCPVVCSPHTPWTALLDSGCGTVVSVDAPSEWAAEIDDRARQGVTERTEAKRRVLDLYTSWRQTQAWTAGIEQVLARRSVGAR